MYDRAGQRPGNARNSLNLGYYEPTEVIDVVSFSANDHVVGAGHIVSLRYAGDLADGRCHVGSLPDLGLDEDISLDHVALRSSVGPQRYRRQRPRTQQAGPRRDHAGRISSPSRNTAN